MEQNYEKSIKRLTEIVQKLEEGGESLENNIQLFSEGTQIISACSKYLDQAEQQITKLMSGENNAE